MSRPTIVFAGAAQVGKSVLLKWHLGRMTGEAYAYDSTIEDEYESTEFQARLLDTGDCVEYKDLLPGWLAQGNAFVLVFNRENSTSIAAVRDLHSSIVEMFGQPSLAPLPTIVVVGTHQSTAASLVSEEDCNKLASSLNAPFVSVCAVDGKGVENVLRAALDLPAVAAPAPAEAVEAVMPVEIVTPAPEPEATPAQKKEAKTTVVLTEKKLVPVAAPAATPEALPQKDAKVGRVRSLLQYFSSNKSAPAATIKVEEKKASHPKTGLAPKKLFASPKPSVDKATVILTGASQTGKSMMIRNWLGRPMDAEVEYDGTIEDEVVKAERGGKLAVTYLEIGGCADVTEHLARADLVMLVFVRSDKESIAFASALREKLVARGCPVLVVGNHSRYGQAAPAPSKEGSDLAAAIGNKAAYLETSSADGQGVERAFSTALSMITGENTTPSPPPRAAGRGLFSSIRSPFSAKKDSPKKSKKHRAGPTHRSAESTPVKHLASAPQTLKKSSDSEPQQSSDSRRSSSGSPDPDALTAEDLKTAPEVEATPVKKTILLAGSPASGKSQLVRWHLGRDHEAGSSYDSTIEDRFEVLEKDKDRTLAATYLDTGGSEDCMSMMPEWIAESQMCVLVVNTEDAASPAQARKIRSMTGPMPALLVANSPSVDASKRTVSRQAVQELAQELRCSAVETCTANGSNVKAAFATAVRLILDSGKRSPRTVLEPVKTKGRRPSASQPLDARRKASVS